jgi:sugar lactone lactonase YvrE
MIRPPLTLAAALLALCLLPGATAQAATSHAAPRSHSGHQDGGPDRIDLPANWNPEGVTTDKKSVFSGSLATGSILKADPRTGETTVLPDSATGKPAVGLDYDKRRGVIWVAGGPTGEVRALDAMTGTLLATFTAPATTNPNGRFINDLVVTRHAVYATDSFNQELLVVPLGDEHGSRHGSKHGRHGSSVPASGPAGILPLTGDIVFDTSAGVFNANGIIKVRHHGLVVGQSNTGLLFRVDRRTGEATTIEGVSAPGADGIEPDHRTLYVTGNGVVTVVKLARDALSGEVVDTLTSPDLSVPSTSALVHDSLWVANARFGVPNPAGEFWLTRIPVGDDD